MTDTMAPGASSDCTKAYPIASDAPTTSPSHGNTSSVCMGSQWGVTHTLTGETLHFVRPTLAPPPLCLLRVAPSNGLFRVTLETGPPTPNKPRGLMGRGLFAFYCEPISLSRVLVSHSVSLTGGIFCEDF